ncbi:MAG: 30S ribosomal protein S3 [Candidatus Eremiobacteraeota bacterium]|nr:30S ribosomal protein S3 [Candidatus Eremiobacteraeota bacterium]
MGQKVHPIGFRIGVIRTWDSLWFSEKHYGEWLHQDLKVRKFINTKLKHAGISRIIIKRPGIDRINLTIRTSKPGIVIGKRGAGIDELRRNLERLTGKPCKINIEEVSHPDLDAKLVGESIAEALERRVSFRRAMKQAVGRSMKAGAKGVKVQCSGRLGGAEIARSERTFDGKIPCHTLRANIDYAIVKARTTYGNIGIKVWIYTGEVFPEKRTKVEKKS